MAEGTREGHIPVSMVFDDAVIERLNGAVVELSYVDDVLIADVRIPAHQP